MEAVAESQGQDSGAASAAASVLLESAYTADEVRVLLVEHVLTHFPAVQGSTAMSAAHPLPADESRLEALLDDMPGDGPANEAAVAELAALAAAAATDGDSIVAEVGAVLQSVSALG